MNIPCKDVVIAGGRRKKSDKQKDTHNNGRLEKHKKQSVNTDLKSSVVDSSFGVWNAIAPINGKPISKRMKNKINATKRKFVMNETILDIGCADQICYYCKAYMWKFEQSEA
ncbi:hypothetical protein POM88_046892 [Heracleum sosnowskyi]|uniref:Uncharacterized protein n=1 Tax=Heracleum sosnowskyi TaxID=360622 RepID=A0AAD8M7Y3_9APIA|nr:hypothetical protein POM88_046892 [Heracleum sosnowskyi]